jgi:cytochrome c
MKLMSKRVFLGLAAAGLLSAATGVQAQGKGNEADAVALVKRAVDYLKKNGKEKALAEFSNPQGQFIDRDLYIFVIDQKAKMLAHGALPKIIGKDVIEMKDADGGYLFKDMLAATATKQNAWVHYKWPNPVSKNIEAKSTYLERVDDMVIGCGIYK